MEKALDNQGGGSGQEVIQEQLAEVLKRLDSVEKRLTNLEKSRERSLTEKYIERGDPRIEACSDFENTVCDRIVYNTSEIPQDHEKLESEVRESSVSVSDRQKPKEGAINSKGMLWHVRMGHASVNYLKKLRKKFISTPELDETIFDDSIMDCDVCIISRINREPIKTEEQRATEPLQIIHFDSLGMISPATYPKKYKYISIFTDDYSRLAMAYPMKTKDEAGQYFELFVNSTRKLLGKDTKICCLKSHQETDFTNNYMLRVLERLGIELQVVCHDKPKNYQIFNQTIQRKVRVLMYDSGLPENMWDLALGSAVFAYNRTPHSSNDMKTPFEMFNSNNSEADITRLRRFGCLGYVKIQRKLNQKFRFIIKRLILIGYKETGYILFNPEDGKFYTTRDVRFNEKSVFAEKYVRTNVNNWESVSKEIDTDTWFIQFEKEEEEQQKEERSISYNKRGREW